MKRTLIPATFVVLISACSPDGDPRGVFDMCDYAPEAFNGGCEGTFAPFPTPEEYKSLITCFGADHGADLYLSEAFSVRPSDPWEVRHIFDDFGSTAFAEVSSSAPFEEAHTIRVDLDSVDRFYLYSVLHTGFGIPSPEHTLVVEFSMVRGNDDVLVTNPLTTRAYNPETDYLDCSEVTRRNIAIPSLISVMEID